MNIPGLAKIRGFFASGTGRKRWKTALLWIASFGLIAFLAGSLTLTVALAWFSRDLPNPNTLLEREVPQSTKIFDRTGTVLLYEIHGEENRTLIQIEDLPPFVPQATVAMEDKRFYIHNGIDWKGLVRAVLVNVVKGKRIQGTSTLTQQFVRNAILTTERSYVRKMKEIVLAFQIERIYTKDQILQLYLNEIPYGSTMYGIESAAHGYFGKSAKDLTLDEAALLASLPQGPDYYSPYGTGSRGDNREKLVGRQHYILDLMAEQGYVSKDEAEKAKLTNTLEKLVPKKVGDIKAPHFVAYVRSQLVDKYGQRTVEEGGLKVTTSLSWDMQQIGEEEVRNGVAERGTKYGFTNSSLVAIDPKTGHILTMVGSKDFFDEEHDGQVNVALRPRQPGSSFKPIVYAAGFAKGYTPEMTLWDVNTKFKTDSKDYEPKNYNLKENGPVSARKALQGSLNIPAVKMLYLVGVGRVLDFAETLGYTTFADRQRFGLALVLGGGEVKLLDHTNAYATFANEGIQVPIASILKVEDAHGAILQEWKPVEGKKAVEREVALTLSDVLSDNGARSYIFGTKNALTLPDRPVAAKTGTTNNFHDAWTMGYIPQLAVGVWVGNNNNAEMKSKADGSVIAAPIWQAFMKRATKGMKVENFPKPQPTSTDKAILLGKGEETKALVDKVSGKLATVFTPPELKEERTYREAHSELWYLDKDDPRGPAPANPFADPQYLPWENAVRAWAKESGWNVTSTAPTEYDDVHTPDNQPKLTIISPAPNSTVTSRDITISVMISAPRRITRIDAVIDGIVVGSALGDTWTFSANLPSSIQPGFHDLVVTATDEVANKGGATITLNISAERAPANVTITWPNNDEVLQSASFPMGVSIYASDYSIAKRIDVYQQEAQSGDTRLIATADSPSRNEFQVTWNSAPAPGKYYLYATIVTADGSTLIGPRVAVTVE